MSFAMLVFPYIDAQKLTYRNSSNGAQFIYSLLYLMMIYNITLCSQEKSWGRLEHERKRLRCTIVRGESFSQDYLLQLPKKILFPIMAYSVLAHWMLGEALQTQEAIWLEHTDDRHIEHSKYIVSRLTHCRDSEILTISDYICSIPTVGSNLPHSPYDWSLLVGLHI